MPFEDFYKKENERTRRWWLSLGAAFLFLIGYFTVGLWVSSKIENLSVEPPVAFNNSDIFQRVDELCAGLPKPEKFYFVRKINNSIDNYGVDVAYYYQSQRTLDEIMPTFIFWFNANGWKPIKDAPGSYIKGNQYISIIKDDLDDSPAASDDIPFSQLPGPKTYYEISCSESAPPRKYKIRT